MYSISDIRAKVEAEQANAKFTSDLASNLKVIEDRIRINYKRSFSLYGGGNAARMVNELMARGLSCHIDGDMVMATL